MTALAIVLIAGSALFGSVSVSAEAPALLGAWHVLVHYGDDSSSSAKGERWDDRAWVFERTGNSLRWTEYPIVIFNDETGRFQSDEANRTFRTLQHWRPDEAQ
ncbi:MAG: hypothetical protein JRD03_01815, partial [Deltaproteobacteria bacterium]|nr:hypothetical protein [Deltaproteobacteria bacterium]